MSSFGSTPRTSRLGALALIALFAGTQVGAFWHQATEKHAICAEHGDVIELGDRAEPAKAHSTPASASFEAESERSLEHAHCELLGRRRDEEAAPPPPPAIDLKPSLVAVVVLRAAAAPARPAAAILRFAPKASPPL